jgi:hypothetical protein
MKEKGTMVGIERRTMVRRSTRAAYQRLAGEEGGVVLDLDTARYFGLNPVGTVIWELIGDDGGTFSDLVARVSSHLPDCPPDVEDDIAEFLQSMAERQLVTLVSRE